MAEDGCFSRFLGVFETPSGSRSWPTESAARRRRSPAAVRAASRPRPGHLLAPRLLLRLPLPAAAGLVLGATGAGGRAAALLLLLLLEASERRVEEQSLLAKWKERERGRDGWDSTVA